MESVNGLMERIKSEIGEEKYLFIYREANDNIHSNKLLSQNPYNQDIQSVEFECYNFHYKFLASWYASNCVSSDNSSKNFIRSRYVRVTNPILEHYVIDFNKELGQLTCENGSRKLKDQELKDLNKKLKDVNSKYINKDSIFGYKYLIYNNDTFMSFTMQALWEDYELTAQELPSEANSCGIYSIKEPNMAILSEYICDDAVFVKILLFGTIFEYSEGYRSEKARIIEVIQ